MAEGGGGGGAEGDADADACCGVASVDGKGTGEGWFAWGGEGEDLSEASGECEESHAGWRVRPPTPAGAGFLKRGAQLIIFVMGSFRPIMFISALVPTGDV
eukprot:CAMPEP_0184374324 /NCGR_PEP_ID=MMETSP1089-20130417/164969_1 /TAXON_ID=38269 ORGANISM="Gloeochaete wittrockiana, Strain SAG46.84" /NCGR_SAMPLE_ID=MMETSP1089 /ASSEMBLY_ACC=CAM_ASM_000445 /LENGTH=100 /DNA_ID=CAMNT_0026717335 /DNA_START=51 /DNA_END=353 /DNA_ORIENTATION=+